MSQCAPHAKLILTEQEEWINQIDERQLFIASANTPKKIGDCLTTNEAPPETFGPLALRAISLPSEVVNKLRKTGEQNPEVKESRIETQVGSQETSSSEMQGLHPTSINLGTINLRDGSPLLAVKDP